MDTLLQDLRYALRTLRRAPGFALAAVLALGLGIGANSAIFSVVDAVLLRPPPYRDGDRLMVIWEENAARGARYNEVAPGNYLAVRERVRSLDALAAWDFADFTLTGADVPERVEGILIEPHLLALLGEAPALGRGFSDEEATPGGARAVLVGHGFWQRRFAGDPEIIGRTLLLDGQPASVIGVLREDFYFGAPADVYAPLVLDAAAAQARDTRWLRVIGRLAPGRSPAAAARELDGIAADLADAYPATNDGWRFSLERFNEGMVQGPIRPMLLFLLGSVAFVLLIACADVSNLLLARAVERGREVAVRAALGAGRARLVRQLLTESLVLGCAGGVVGAFLAVWGLEALRAGLPPVALEFTPSLASMHIDGRVLAFTFTLSLATGLLFGVLPALRAARADLGATLRRRDGRTGDTPRHRRTRAILVGAEVALALVLLTGGTQLMRSFVAQLGANPTFRSADLLVAWLRLPAEDYDADRLTGFQRLLLERLRALPAVRQAGLSNAFPLSGEDHRRPVAADASAVEPVTISVRTISTAYLATLGAPILAGRDLAPDDRAGSRPVALVSRTLARRMFGDDAIGKRIRIAGDTVREVVGVAADVSDWRLASRDDAMVYVPLEQYATRRFAIVARARTGADDAFREIQAAVRALEPAQPLFGMRTMDDVLDEAVSGQRIGAWTMSVFAAVALLLALVGVYGVMAYTVSQRAHELGVRAALGAAPADLRRLVLLQGLLPVLGGLIAGAALSFLAAAALAVGIAPDAGSPATTVALTASALLVAALAALAQPIRRATRVDPLAALRSL